MELSIGETSRQFGLPISTLRYYDRQGLFGEMERKGGQRKFTDKEQEALRVIDCLKKSGLEIRDIKTFMDLCQQGDSTWMKRLELFEKQKEKINEEIRVLEKARAMIEYKCWYYNKVLELQSEEAVMELIPDHLPEDVKAAWQTAHCQTAH